MLKRILSLTLAAVLALAVFATAAFAEAIDEGVTYFVYTENGKDLNVRNAPNGELIGTLHYGEEVKVTAIINDYWALIEFQDDVPGYVNTRFLVPVHPDEIKKAIEEEQEHITGDPMTDIDAEFASAVDVENYKITCRPARVTTPRWKCWKACGLTRRRLLNRCCGTAS